MSLLVFSSAFVGFMHSLAPGHWLPVVLMVKARRWNLRHALLGAVVAASGHILVSLGLGVAAIQVGTHFLAGSEERFERYGALILLVFGTGYAVFSYLRHSSCHGHGHHGPDLSKARSPFYLLFSLGLVPCVAALPVFIAAAGHGLLVIALCMAAFALGVVAALISGTTLVSLGLAQLDHPWLEHYGDVVTGGAVALMGVILWFLPL